MNLYSNGCSSYYYYLILTQIMRITPNQNENTCIPCNGFNIFQFPWSLAYNNSSRQVVSNTLRRNRIDFHSFHWVTFVEWNCYPLSFSFVFFLFCFKSKLNIDTHGSWLMAYGWCNIKCKFIMEYACLQTNS